MRDQGAPRPRRALAPLPEDDDATEGASTAATSDPATGSRLAAASDTPPTEPETRQLRRLAVSPESPASPVPAPKSRAWRPSARPAPPKPVLPDQSGGLPASAGRRFSASTDPYEVVSQAPRRSATSVTSPPVPGPVESVTETSATWTLPRSTNSPKTSSPAPEAEADGSPPGGRRGGNRKLPARAESTAVEPAGATTKRGIGRAIAVIASVAAIAGLVTGGVLWFGPHTFGPAPAASTSPSGTPEPPLDPLLTAADADGLAGSTWVATAADGAADPTCLPVGATGMPSPDRTAQRVLTAQGSTADSITHVVQTYPDAATAARAYDARLSQSGNCTDTVALIVAGYEVEGLADAAAAITIDVQNDPAQHHTVLISQTGRNVSMLDLTTAEDPPAVEDLAAIAARPLERLCSGGEGTCPAAEPSVADSVPAAGATAGWLIEADLPRINLGQGRWQSIPPTSALTITGTQCETVDLKSVADSTALQRTLLLIDDPAIPAALGFGVDQVTYRFATADTAKEFQSQLDDDISDCASRVPTATVEEGSSVKGTGAESMDFSGKSYRVIQKTASGTDFVYLVAVLRVEDRVTYLMATPTDDVDFSNAEWKAIMTRAGQRVTQLP